MRKTTSEAAATSAGEEADTAERERRGMVLEWVRLKTVRSNPAVSMCWAMGRPITPVPINPTRVVDGEMGRGEGDDDNDDEDIVEMKLS